MTEKIKVQIYLTQEWRNPPLPVVENSKLPIELEVMDKTLSGSNAAVYAWNSKDGRYVKNAADGSISGQFVTIIPSGGLFLPGKGKLQVHFPTGGGIITREIPVDCQPDFSAGGAAPEAEDVKSLVERAEEVASHIPSDFATLSDDVNTLKDDLISYDNLKYYADEVRLTGKSAWISKVVYIDSVKPNTSYYIHVDSVENVKSDVVAVIGEVNDSGTVYNNVNLSVDDASNNRYAIIRTSSGVARLRLILYRTSSQSTADSDTTVIRGVSVTECAASIVRQIKPDYAFYTSDFKRINGETDDSAKLQRVIDLAISTKNATVVIDEKLYIASGVTISYVNGTESITIRGAGVANFSAIARYNQNNHDSMNWYEPDFGIIVTDSCTVFDILNPYEGEEWDAVKFENLSIFNATNVRESGKNEYFAAEVTCIHYVKATIQVKNCYFYGCKYGIYNPATDNSYSDRVIISETVIDRFSDTAVMISRGDACKIDSCFFGAFIGWKAFVKLQACAGCTISNVTINNFGYVNAAGIWTAESAPYKRGDDAYSSHSFILMDSNVDISAIHSEHSNGSSILYVHGGFVTCRALAAPLNTATCALVRYGGNLDLEGCYLQYLPGKYAESWTDVYAISSGSVYVSSTNKVRVGDELKHFRCNAVGTSDMIDMVAVMDKIRSL